MEKSIRELKAHRKLVSHAKRIRLDRERGRLECEMAALVSTLLKLEGSVKHGSELEL